ncbi:MAG TPA: M67 family metallopeptidase [Candidatus Limnocylindrales bacterium]
MVADEPATGGPATPAAHPGPVSAQLPAAIVQAIIDHARAENPNEACGIVVGTAAAADGGRATRWEPTRNAAASRFLYEVDAADLLRLTIATDDAGEVFWAIVHSHTHTPPRPSTTDIGAAQYPDALYILVSLAPDEADPVSATPSLRAWRILDGTAHEVALEVTA